MILDPETDLSFSLTLNAPRAVIWQCWTQPQHLKEFFVPKPHFVDSCDIDLRVGGRFNTVMNVEGNSMSNEGVFLEIVPEKKLVFTDAYQEGWKPAADPFMTAIIDLADTDGGTFYTVTRGTDLPKRAKRIRTWAFSTAGEPWRASWKAMRRS